MTLSEPVNIDLLKTVHELKAVLLDQLAVLLFEDNKQKCYTAIDRLVHEGYVTLRRYEKDQRKTYALLTQKGLNAIGADEQATQNPAWKDKNRAARIIERNDIYCRAIQAGISPEHFIDRQKALTMLYMHPRYALFDWMLTTRENHRWLLYRRQENIRSQFLDTTNRISQITGHVLFYDDYKVLARDLTFFIERALPNNFYLLLLEEMARLRSIVFHPEETVQRIKSHLSTISPRGQLVETPLGCPYRYAWQGPQGSRLLLADLTARNLGLLATVPGFNPDYAVRQNWGSAVALVVDDPRPADKYLSVVGRRDWLWVIRLDLPPHQSVFKCGPRGLVPYQKSEGV